MNTKIETSNTPSSRSVSQASEHSYLSDCSEYEYEEDDCEYEEEDTHDPNNQDSVIKMTNDKLCLDYGDEAHQLLTCSDLTLWEENFIANTSSEIWILANTESCPNCHVRIEKNQYCNHMTCGQCSHHFCWICMGDCSTHTQCNRIDTEFPTQGSADIGLDRNLHYVKQYHIHADAEKEAKERLETAKSAFSDTNILSLDGDSFLMVESLKQDLMNAIGLVVQCRRTLKQSYIYAYCHFHDTIDEGDCGIFHSLQGTLERLTWNLSAMTEGTPEGVNKVELLDNHRAVKKLLNEMVSYVKVEL